MDMPLFAGTPDLSLDIGAGRGYVDNLNNARTDDLKEGSGFTSTWITVGLSERALKEARLYLKGSYEGTYFDSLSDLSVNGLTAEAGLLSTLMDSVLLKVSANLGMRSYGSSERDSEFYGLLISLRHQTLSRFATKVGYRYTNNDAEEAVFSYSSNKVSISGEFQITQEGYLSIEYSAELRENTFYETVAVQGSASIHGRRPSTTFGPNQVAFKEDVTVNTVSFLWDQDFYKGLYGQAEYSYSWVQSDPGIYTDQLVSGRIGYRF
jgi:hypothetical protein